MLDVYRQLANRVGSNEAVELAHDLIRWHDAMVRHERAITRLGFSTRACVGYDDCPHGEARDLWLRAQRVFGDEARALAYLRTSADGVLLGEGA